MLTKNIMRYVSFMLVIVTLFSVIALPVSAASVVYVPSSVYLNIKSASIDSKGYVTVKLESACSKTTKNNYGHILQYRINGGSWKDATKVSNSKQNNTYSFKQEMSSYNMKTLEFRYRVQGWNSTKGKYVYSSYSQICKLKFSHSLQKTNWLTGNYQYYTVCQKYLNSSNTWLVLTTKTYNSRHKFS